MTKPKIFVVTRTPKGLDNVISVQPNVAGQFYCAVINVADSPCATFDYQRAGVPSFWFPIHEVEHWGYTSFLAAIRVVNEYYKSDKPVLIHCHAGANRSPSVAFSILKAKGYTDTEAEESLNYPNMSKVFQRNIELGHIPRNIIEFLTIANNSDESKSVNGIMLQLQTDYINHYNQKMGSIKDYTLNASTNSPTQLVYDAVAKRFVIKKDKEWRATPTVVTEN